jgi:hypothetical protein
MTAVEFLEKELYERFHLSYLVLFNELIQQAKEMEKEQKIALLKLLVYSVCIGDDVEDVEEWLKEHELNKSE